MSRARKGRIRYFAGLDLGQLADYSALAIMERVYKYEDHLDIETQVEHRLVHLMRFELGTPYPEIVDWLGEFFSREPLAGRTRLAVDATGIGLAVFQDLKKARLPVREIKPVLITAGQQANKEGGIWRVPKRDLIHPLRVRFEEKSIKIPRGLTYLEALTEELSSYEMKVNQRTGHDSYANDPRETPHDDLVLATALAYWSMSNKFGRTRVQVVPYSHISGY
jgi:hypothetical protein